MIPCCILYMQRIYHIAYHMNHDDVDQHIYPGLLLFGFYVMARR